MNISIYSVLTAFLWFNLFILILSFLRWKSGVILGYRLFPLIAAIVLSLVRLLLPFEPSFVVILRSEHVLSFLLDASRIEVLTLGTTDLTLGWAIFLVLSLVSVLLLTRLLILVHREGRKIQSYAQTEDRRLLSLFQQVTEDAPSKHTCRLCVTKQASSPYIFGVFSSTIVVPEPVLSLSDQDVCYILQHEWQHHLEKDVPVKLLVQVLCCVMWWNPLIFLLRHNLNQTLELKCDAGVMKGLDPEQRINYAEALLRVLTICGGTNAPASKAALASIPFSGLASFRKKVGSADTMQRFDAVLASGHRSKKIGVAVTAVLLLLFLLSFCFVIQPFGLPPEEDLIPPEGSSDYSRSPTFTKQNAYLVDNQDGTYAFFIDGEYQHTIDSKALNYEPFNLLPVISSGEAETVP